MSQRWFEVDASEIVALKAFLRKCYPTLHAFVANGKVIIKGTYAAVDGDGYRLEIRLPDDYPHSVPDVWETGGRIPRIQDRHVHPTTGALCVGVPEELWLAFEGDFSIGRFVSGPIHNFLIGNSLVEEGQDWPFEEASHGGDGILEFYTRHMGITDRGALREFLVSLSQGKVPGHSRCPCGSGKIIRACHADAWRSLWDVPKSLIASSLKQFSS